MIYILFLLLVSPAAANSWDDFTNNLATDLVSYLFLPLLVSYSFILSNTLEFV
jgi:hypothetical protein